MAEFSVNLSLQPFQPVNC